MQEVIKHKYTMGDDYIGDDGNVSIYQVLKLAALPPDDHRHIPSSLRDALVEHGIEQMRQQGEKNAALLRKLRDR